jgi:hypothetical protein
MYHLSHEPVPYIDILKVFIREICLKIMKLHLEERNLQIQFHYYRNLGYLASHRIYTKKKTISEIRRKGREVKKSSKFACRLP